MCFQTSSLEPIQTMVVRRHISNRYLSEHPSSLEGMNINGKAYLRSFLLDFIPSMLTNMPKIDLKNGTQKIEIGKNLSNTKTRLQCTRLLGTISHWHLWFQKEAEMRVELSINSHQLISLRISSNFQKLKRTMRSSSSLSNQVPTRMIFIFMDTQIRLRKVRITFHQKASFTLIVERSKT